MTNLKKRHNLLCGKDSILIGSCVNFLLIFSRPSYLNIIPNKFVITKRKQCCYYLPQISFVLSFCNRKIKKIIKIIYFFLRVKKEINFYVTIGHQMKITYDISHDHKINLSKEIQNCISKVPLR
jgi:hypothetical protein